MIARHRLAVNGGRLLLPGGSSSPSAAATKNAFVPFRQTRPRYGVVDRQRRNGSFLASAMAITHHATAGGLTVPTHHVATSHIGTTTASRSTALAAAAYSPSSSTTTPYVSRPTGWTGGPIRSYTSSSTSSSTVPSWNDHASGTGTPDFSTLRQPMKPYPLSEPRTVPPHIVKPPYAATGNIPYSKQSNQILLHNDPDLLQRMRSAAVVARKGLNLACSLAKPGVTTDEIDAVVHNALIANGAYPSPLNYARFPKSLCSSVNEVICHGIPDMRPLQMGDIVSFDISCFIGGVHGDNCATIIVGDEQPSGKDGDDRNGTDPVTGDSLGKADWRGVPFRTDFDSAEQEMQFVAGRRLVHAARQSLYAAIDAIGPGACLSDIGGAIQDVSDAYGYSTVEKYRGHGINTELHCPPFVKHYRNSEKLELVPGMIFTIEPMLAEGAGACHEWSDDWTVVTDDGGMAAQFEHTVHITDTGVEILTESNELL